MSARAEIIPVFVPHLGCRHNCVFCNQKRISGSEQAASVETVKEAIARAAALPRTGAKRQLAFYGGSFTAIEESLQETLLAAAQQALQEGSIDAIRLSTRPDAIDERVLSRLKRYGVDTVELGAQSMDDEVLRLSRRGHTAADVVRASNLVREAGFSLVLQMMTGLPGDSPERDMETARRLIALRPDAVRLYPTVIVRDTELYDRYLAGEYAEHSVEDAVEVCAKLLPLFEDSGIEVIRLGLNPTEELTGGAAVAGAYHPALGELVKSRVYRNRARALLDGIAPHSHVVLGVEARAISQMTGQKRENLRNLCKEFSLDGLKVRPAAVKKGEIVILSVENDGKV